MVVHSFLSLKRTMAFQIIIRVLITLFLSEAHLNFSSCRPIKLLVLLQVSFLALLDYVSRAHEIAICPSSVGPSVRPSVVRRPSVRVTIISELNVRISFKF